MKKRDGETSTRCRKRSFTLKTHKLKLIGPINNFLNTHSMISFGFTCSTRSHFSVSNLSSSYSPCLLSCVTPKAITSVIFSLYLHINNIWQKTQNFCRWKIAYESHLCGSIKIMLARFHAAQNTMVQHNKHLFCFFYIFMWFLSLTFNRGFCWDFQVPSTNNSHYQLSWVCV